MVPSCSLLIYVMVQSHKGQSKVSLPLALIVGAINGFGRSFDTSDLTKGYELFYNIL
jgi:hypothetical protein